MEKLIRNTICLLAVILMFSSELASAEKLPVWIDMDPSCGLSAADDVDDCWALLLALKSDEIEIRGVSTVFGNVAEEKAYPVVKQFLDLYAHHSGNSPPTIHRGATDPVSENVAGSAEVVSSIAAALEKEPLMIVALGPLTNIATLLRDRPDLTKRVRSVIAIAGSLKGERRFFFEDSGLLHFHDLNFLKDPKAFELVIGSGVPMVFVPFETANQVQISSDDLDTLSGIGTPEAWLAESSRGWLGFWNKRLGEKGFHPFDSLAMGYTIFPEYFVCDPVQARVRSQRGLFVARDELIIESALVSESRFSYCHSVSPQFHTTLMSTLSRPQSGSPLLTQTLKTP